jgi:hypothetical protein
MASPNEVVNAVPNTSTACEQDVNATDSASASARAREEQPITSVGQTATNRFIPYHSPHHNPTKGRYITSNDPRGYMYVSSQPAEMLVFDTDADGDNLAPCTSIHSTDSGS